ncbi:MAG: hypothetical protein ACI8Y7_000402 [Candidatus Woesearchaeota archaeon]|jgi:hypothetical protein
MDYTVRDLIIGLSHAELIKMKRDLDHGALHLKKLVITRIKDLETAGKKICASCGSTILDENHHTYTILFGPSDFRKKATCCCIECLSEFQNKLKSYDTTTKIHNS